VYQVCTRNPFRRLFEMVAAEVRVAQNHRETCPPAQLL
jgi:hypothetical protein